MTSIASLRLHTQKLRPSFADPSEVVRWFGAMQAQDFAGAKWAIGLRTKHVTDAQVEQAFNEGKILRTHIMRPTWHFVTSEDISWLLTLTSERVHAYNGHYYRKSGLNKDIFQKSNAVLQKTLQGGQQLTRVQLQQALEAAHIPVQDMGLSYTIMQAELEGIICSGPRIGKQFTYMLLEERIPKKIEKGRDEALGELTKRYFQSHGPAQIADFAWWSGLTIADAKRGIEIANLQKITREDTVYYALGKEEQTIAHNTVYLIPPFDEYFVAYKDRSAILDTRYKKQMNFGGGMITGAIVSGGIIIGTWKRTFQKDTIHIQLFPFTKFTSKEYQGISQAAKRYAAFHSKEVVLI